MPKPKVAILRTSPATVLRDYHSVMNLAGYQGVLAKDADTALKINISWHVFFRGSSTTPWQHAAHIGKTGVSALRESFGVLATCLKHAPEFASRRRHAKGA
jgi:hypothetical protein